MKLYCFIFSVLFLLSGRVEAQTIPPDSVVYLDTASSVVIPKTSRSVTVQIDTTLWMAKSIVVPKIQEPEPFWNRTLWNGLLMGLGIGLLLLAIYAFVTKNKRPQPELHKEAEEEEEEAILEKNSPSEVKKLRKLLKEETQLLVQANNESDRIQQLIHQFQDIIQQLVVQYPFLKDHEGLGRTDENLLGKHIEAAHKVTAVLFMYQRELLSITDPKQSYPIALSIQHNFQRLQSSSNEPLPILNQEYINTHPVPEYLIRFIQKMKEHGVESVEQLVLDNKSVDLKNISK